MTRLHPQQWGERQQIDVRDDDWSLLTEEVRRRKADELIAMIREEMREPPMQPPPWCAVARKHRRSLAGNLDRAE
jgi:hypothetical protein